MNFCKRNYQPILRYLYTEAIKRQGEISLHKHFNAVLKLNICSWDVVCCFEESEDINEVSS